MASIREDFRNWVLRQRVGEAAPHEVDGERLRIETPGALAEINLYAFDDNTIVEYRITRTSDGESTFFLHFMLEDMARAEELFGQMADALRDEASHRVNHVLLTCTSAFTTTMFANKMNEVAQTLSLDYDFEAMSVDRALRTTNDYVAILLAPQVAHLRQQMIDAHPGVTVFEIPGKVFGSYDAPGALRLLLHARREMHAPDEVDTALKAVRALDDDRRVLVITLFFMREYSRLGYRLYDHGEPQTQGAVRKPYLDFRDVEDLMETLVARGIDVGTLDAVGIAVPGVTRRGVVSLPNIEAWNLGLAVNNYDLGVRLSKRFGIPVYVDNNCNAAAVGCYVSQDECESLIFFRHAFGHPAGGMGTIIDGRLLKGFQNLAGEPKHFISRFAFDGSLDDALWTADGMHLVAEDVVLACMSIVAPEAVYLAVDTVDDADEFRASIQAELGERFTPSIHLVTDYVDRVYLGELALCLQKLRDPHYRSLGVDVWKDA